MRHATIIFAVLACAMPCAVSAEFSQSEWVSIPVLDPNREFFFDQNSVQLREGEIEFWDRIIFKKPTQLDEPSGHMIKEKRILHRADCKTQEWSVVRGAIFDEQGKFLEALTPTKDSTPKTLLKLGTVAALEVAKVCKLMGFDSSDSQVIRIGPQVGEGANAH